MGVRKDLKRARRHSDLAGRTTVDVVRDEHGTVREARTAALAAPLESGSVADIPFTNAAEEPDAVVLRRKDDGGVWRPVTAAEFAGEVTAAAKGLIAAGLEPGDRVALMSRTRYEWTVLDFAIWAAGGQSVPVYATSSAEQIEWIVRDSGARFVIAETAENTATVRAALAEQPGTGQPGTVQPETDPPRLWQIAPETKADDEPGEVPRAEDAAAVPGGGATVVGRGVLAELGALGQAVGDDEVAERRAALTAATIATVCYTSGTTGRPKGCVLTHGNLHAEAVNTVELLHPVFKAVSGQIAATLLFLPLAHILGRTIELACVLARIELGHCPSIKPEELRPELRSFEPTFVVGVPYLFEKIHDTGRATAEKIGRGASFERADRIGVRYAEAVLGEYLGTGPGPGLGLRLGWGLYDVLVYRRIRKEVGGRLRYAISGGSPLDKRLNLFFMASGITIFEGYGLTESTAAATVIPPLSPRPGTVGQPVPGTAIRIADDGEVLIKGGVVFTSYWNDPAATDAVLSDGWFASGDLGALDDDGYLTITGRKKDIIVTSGGKNVSPAVLEDRLRSRPPIGQCMVVGDNRSFVAALVTLEPEAVAHWLAVRGMPVDTPMIEVVRDPRMIADVQKAVDYANAAVSRAESIRKFVLVEGEFTEDNGLLTPSLKIKRHAVGRAYAAQIEALYAG